MDPEVFDFEIGIPANTPVTPAGRVTQSSPPARTVFQTFYCDGYEDLGEAWGEFKTWLKDNGHKADPSLWEVYAVGPESDSDSPKYETELYRPIVD